MIDLGVQRYLILHILKIYNCSLTSLMIKSLCDKVFNGSILRFCPYTYLLSFIAIFFGCCYIIGMSNFDLADKPSVVVLIYPASTVIDLNQ